MDRKLLIVLLLVASPVNVRCQSNIGVQNPANANAQNLVFYFDSNSDCNGPIKEIFGFDATIRGLDISSTPLGPKTCMIRLKSTGQFDGTVLDIEVRAMNVLDCSTRITIYDGDGAQSTLMAYDCYSNGVINKRRFQTTGDTATFIMTRENINSYNFDIEIKVNAIREQVPTSNARLKARLIQTTTTSGFYTIVATQEESQCSQVLSLTMNECSSQTEKCRAPFMDVVQQENSTLSSVCNGARGSVNCVNRLVCPWEIFLRLTLRSVQLQLLTRGIQGCELGLFFYKDSEGSAECRQKRENCTNTYLDHVLEHFSSNHSSGHLDHGDHSTALCGHLNTFSTCKMSNTACPSTKEEVDKFFQDEKSRLRLTDCAETYNAGRTITPPATLFMLLAILYFIAGCV